MSATQRAELFDAAAGVMARVKKSECREVSSVQDAMIHLRVDWEELQARLRNKRLVGFDAATEAILQLGATAVAAAASLQAYARRQVAAAEAMAAKEAEAEEVKLIPITRKKAACR